MILVKTVERYNDEVMGRAPVETSNIFAPSNKYLWDFGSLTFCVLLLKRQFLLNSLIQPASRESEVNFFSNYHIC